MRKLVLAGIVAFLAVASCSKIENNLHDPGVDPIVILEDNDPDAEITVAEAAPAEEAAPVVEGPAAEGLALMDGSDCRTCHKDRETVIGPSYLDVANKYTEADTDMLIAKIIDGGSGNWGEIPMTPHPNLDKADVEKMVTYILSVE